MPALKQDDRILLARLVLRRQLYRQTDGNANFSDAALYALAELKPTKLEACLSLPDVTQRQIEKYGSGYIAVVREHLQKIHTGAGVVADESVRAILSSLEQQLIGINRRNRLLCTGKLRARTGYDLTMLADAAALNKLLFGNGKLTVRKTTDAHGKRGAYESLNDLLREINRTLRESGSADLYVGYPYVYGKLSSDPFPFEAPLLLFPISGTKEDGAITLKSDSTRSVLYNTNFSVAVTRLNGRMENIEQDVLEDASAFDLKKILADYEKIGVKIEPSKIDYVPYVPEEKMQNGLKLKGACVLGKFSLQGTSLQRDFDRILNWSKLPRCVVELVENVGKEDLQAKLDALGDVPGETSVRVREKDLVYINELNAAQEKVVATMQQKDRLVVAGPPGTGKSQVITSVIADFVGRGKSVLMVTEKKAALDVVRSRLGVLNDFCLQIDDAEDKLGFYDQILGMFDKSDSPVLYGTDYFSDAIENDFDRLRTIRNEVYAEREGVRIADLYRAVAKPNLNDPLVKSRWDDIEKSGFNPDALSYAEFVAATKRMAEQQNGEMLRRWMPVMQNKLVTDRVRRDLKPAEIGAFLVSARRYLKILQQDALVSGGRHGKGIRRSLEQELAAVLNCRISGKVYAEVCESIDVLFAIMEDYNWWLDATAYLESMSEGERSLNVAVYRLATAWNITIDEAMNRVRDYYINGIIADWELTHRERLRDIDNYEGIIHRIHEGIEAKRRYTIDRLYATLSKNFANMRVSKRFGDMRRIAESARRMSVMRYLQRFDNELFLGVKIWLLTPEIASSILPLREGMFDLVVFDEASQIYVERALPALVRGKKILIVGDNKQLRPSSLGSGRIGMDDETLEEEGIESTALEVESLLDLAEAKYERVMLEAHYRAASEELIAFSNYAFYKGGLLISPNLHPVDKPIEVIKVNDGVWEKRSNIPEANRVVKLLKKVLSEKGDATVGIITFNSTQRDVIERSIEAAGAKSSEFARLVDIETRRTNNGEDIGLFVKNIENVQGDERDIIIFSMGYALDKNGKFSRNFGWLNAPHGENRLNVAITRAKKKIYFVTSMDSNTFDVGNLPSYGPRLLKSYMAYAEAVTRGDSDAVMRALKSVGVASSRGDLAHRRDPYADKLQQEFEMRGFDTERDVGIGGTVLDLSVTYPNGQVEGYESDLDLYTPDSDTRSRDYHRRRYLETRGWKIHRIWSHDVYERSQK